MDRHIEKSGNIILDKGGCVTNNSFIKEIIYGTKNNHIYSRGGASIIQSDYNQSKSFSTGAEYSFSIADLANLTEDKENPKIAITATADQSGIWYSVSVFAGSESVGYVTLTPTQRTGNISIDIDWDKGTEYKITVTRTGGSSGGTVSGNIIVSATLVKHINLGYTFD